MTRILWLAAVMLGWLMLLSYAERAFAYNPADLAPTSVCPTWSSTQMLCLHNYTRRAHHLTPLSKYLPLYRSAGAKADRIEQCGVFTHFPCGDSAWRFFPTGLCTNPGGTCGENLAYGYPTVRQTYVAWLDSPGHYANIVNSNFDCYGSGYRPGAPLPKLWVVEFCHHLPPQYQSTLKGGDAHSSRAHRGKAVATGTAAVAAVAVTRRPDAWDLHPAPRCKGSHGQRVRDLQWMLQGHRPNVFRRVLPTYHGQVNGCYGPVTAAAVVAYKYRIGYPEGMWQKTAVGPYMFALLKGHINRKTYWVALAQQRIQEVAPGVTKRADRIRRWEVSQLGVHETCCNRGPVVDQYQRYFGLIGQQWCAIFQQYAFTHNGEGLILGATFYVPTIIDRARHAGWLNAKAKVGSLVAFVNGYGVGYHIAYVAKVTASGYVSIDGNYGDAVREVWHPWNDRLRVFIWKPGVAAPL